MSEQQPAVVSHSFPELKRPRAQVPEWMRSTPGSVLPARFDGRPHETPDRQQEDEQANVRVDPLSAEREALAKAKADVDVERQELGAKQKELEEAQASLVRAVEEVAAARALALEGVRAEIADIAVSVARAILHDAFSEAPERAAALAKAATSDEEATLRVGPALHIALLESSDAPPATLDTSLAPYGCVAETPTKRVLTGLEDRLDEVLRALREAT